MGDSVRDWQLFVNDVTLFPYDDQFLPLADDSTHPCLRFLWIVRTSLANNKMFAGKTKVECGLHWYEFGRLTAHKLMTPFSIVFANIATHFHAYLDRGGNLFNTTSPLIKLKPDATEDDHLLILGYLGSSAACFCMKQVSHEKQMMGGESIRIESKAKVPYAYSSTQLGKLPIPEALQSGPLRERLIELSRRMDSLAAQLGRLTPQCTLARGLVGASGVRKVRSEFDRDRVQIRAMMVLLQEEIDFTIYAMWGFADQNLLSATLEWPEVAIDAGERPFEILRGRSEDDFPVPEKTPSLWPADLRDLWQRRMDAITGSSELRLIEEPHYKRRWIGRQGKYNLKRDENAFESACGEWLQDRVESYCDFDGRMGDRGPGAEVGGHGESQQASADPRPLNPESWSAPPLAAIQLYSLAKLADVASKDADFMQVAELYRDDPAFNVLALVERLVTAEAVPLLPILRYKDSGLRKREEWEKTWELQRREDAVRDELEEVRRQLTLATNQEDRYRLETKIKDLTISIPVPPKYVSADFLSGNQWRLRGKLDVPKERWISFPGAEAEDGSLMICWAGYNHLQQAQAISAWYVEIRDQQGGHNDKRLIPLLACLLELLPWIKQWHNSSDNEFNMSMADFFEGFIKEESRQLPRPAVETAEPDDAGLFPDTALTITYGWSLPEIQAWKPSARRPAKRAAKKAAKKPAAPKKATKKRGKKVEEG